MTNLMSQVPKIKLKIKDLCEKSMNKSILDQMSL